MSVDSVQRYPVDHAQVNNVMQMMSLYFVLQLWRSKCYD